MKFTLHLDIKATDKQQQQQKYVNAYNPDIAYYIYISWILFKGILNKNCAYFDKKLRWGMGEMDELFCLHLKRGGRDKL